MEWFNFFAVITLFIWAWRDAKTGYVENLILLAPLIPLPFINLHIFLFLFLPVMISFLLIHYFLKAFGMADVIAIPFVLFSLAYNLDFSIIFFPFTLYLSCKIYPEKQGSQKFIPVLFIAFIFSISINYFIQNFLGFC